MPDSVINHAIVPKAHPRRHIFHKYWARKPHNVVASYIDRYTKKGDIVLDPFSGSGVTFCEAIRLGRRAIAIDLNPMSALITRAVTEPVNIKEIKKTFDAIQDKIKKQILDLYKTKCTKCPNSANVLVTIYENEKPLEIRFECENCGKRYEKSLSKEDFDLIKRINGQKIPFWYPDDPLYYSEHKPFTKKEKAKKLSDLFTKRNLIALSILYNGILEISNKKFKELFQVSFTSMVHLASKMTPDRPTRPYSSFWALQSYWIPPRNMESNVWALFESAVVGRQGIVEAKTDTDENIKDYEESRNYEDFKNKKKNALIITGSVLQLVDESSSKKNILEENSVDYIFTDPPYGGDVQYAELSFMWNSWLKNKTTFEEEIIINDNQGKDFETYGLMLNKAFKQMFSVLKPNKFLTVTFHNTDIKIRNALIRGVVFSGFELEKILYQPPARASAKQLLQPYGSAVGDYYIRFKKPSEKKKLTVKEIDSNNYERIVVKSVIKILAERYEPTAYAWILNTIDMELTKQGYNLYKDPEDTKKIIEKHKGKEFILVDVIEGGKKVKKWWLKDISSIAHLKNIPLNERIEKSVIDVLRKNVIVTFDDILQSIFIEYDNSLTPETDKIVDVLEEYADKTSDGRWMLKINYKARESQHDIMIKYLVDIGKKFGFDTHFDLTRKSIDYKSFHLRETDEIVNLDRVKEIDVIWIKKDKIISIFEVENSTGITDGIIRGSNIRSKDIKRVIVIPDERLGFLKRRFEEPMIKEKVQEDKWSVITYNKLEKYVKSQNKNQESFFKLLNGTPSNEKKQTKLGEY